MRGGMPLTWRDAGPPPKSHVMVHVMDHLITCDLGGGLAAPYGHFCITNCTGLYSCTACKETGLSVVTPPIPCPRHS